MRAQEKAILQAFSDKGFNIEAPVFPQAEAREIINHVCGLLGLKASLTRGAFQGYIASGSLCPAVPPDGRNYLLSTVDLLRLTAMFILVSSGVLREVASRAADLVFHVMKEGGFERWSEEITLDTSIDYRDVVVLQREGTGWKLIEVTGDEILRLAMLASPALLIVNARIIGGFVLSEAAKRWRDKALRLLEKYRTNDQ